MLLDCTTSPFIYNFFLWSSNLHFLLRRFPVTSLCTLTYTEKSMVGSCGKRKRVRDAIEEESKVENEQQESEITENAEGDIGYEQFREQRIKENKERLQKLGILALSSKHKSETLRQKRRNPLEKKTTHSPLPPYQPPRRSTRLKSLAPVSYAEIRIGRTPNLHRDIEISIPQGSQPEVYTEEHEKLLGNCKADWELLVDGYDEDGDRIYDSVNGETCHQCRQKTLCQHTHCSRCDLVQGKLCGDCLYTRYGENVLEANQNPEWVCPVCRGICNCSICRKAKGWMPTGNIAKKVLSIGFKSVAHYLIQTRRSETSSKPSAAKTLVEEDHFRPGDEGETTSQEA